MKIRIIKFVCNILGYEVGLNSVKLPVWTIKEKSKNGKTSR
jgi:hypothetical protein